MTTDLMSLNISIPKGNPFLNDKLGRRQVGNMMINIFNKFEKGAVIALDSPWGTGKTTFIRMLQEQLSDEHYTSIYFNAWDTDFAEDPLIALISELGKNKILPEKVVEKIGRIVLSGGKELVKSILKSLVGGSDIVNAIVDELSNMGTETLKAYSEQKKDIEEFKELLSEYISGEFSKNINSGCDSFKLPVVFFIDELDRCNPTYAVKVLERIKHCFSVPNLIFVLSIDKEQLKNSIKGYFHSQDFDSDEYLRRFIDVEYSLPSPNYTAYCEYLFDIFSLKFSDYTIENEVKEIIYSVARKQTLTLRQLEKIFIHLSIIYRSFSEGQDVQYVVFFCLLNKFWPEILRKIENKDYMNLEDLYDSLLKIYPNNNDDTNYFLGQILGLYAKFSGHFNLTKQLVLSPDKNISDDAIQQLKTGINLSISYNFPANLNNILDKVHLYASITRGF